MRQPIRSKRSLHWRGRANALTAVFAVLVASCGVQPPEAEPLAQSEAALGSLWQSTTPMPEQRRYHSATVLASDKVLVVGGWNSNGFIATARTYDPASSTWSPAGTLTLARQAHTATLLPSGKVLVVGGETSNGHTDTAELHDPEHNSWSLAGATSQKRSYNTATLLLSNKVLVVGGQNLNGAQKTVDLYDPDPAPGSASWSPATRLIEHRHSHTAVRLASGKVLVAGGSAGGALKTTELYDPTTDTCIAGTCSVGTWKAGPSMQTARYGHTATELPNGKILVVGGKVGGQKAPLPVTSEFTATAELYDPSNDTWTSAGTLASARGYHTATLVAGKVLVAGGRGPGSGEGVVLSTVEVYDPDPKTGSTTGSWSTTDSMLQVRANHAAVYSNPLRKVLVLGGTSPGVVLATADLYDSCGVLTCNTPQCYREADTSCTNGTCSYKPLSAGTPCDDGNPGTLGDTCDGAGTCTGCGDGVKSGSEACDDGNTVSETSCAYGQMSCTACDATCTATLSLTGPYCGDGAKNGTETCDDGNTATETACQYGQASCTTCDATCSATLSLTGSYCGDATKNDSEACDDGNTVTETACPYAQMSCSACDATCTAALSLSGPYCGDATKNGAEACDDGNTTSENSCPYGTKNCTTCNSTCSAPLSLTGPYCGDATKNGAEACDDGNTTSENSCPYGQASCTTCDATCTGTLSLTGSYCGDGVRNGPETCDDGNTTSETACPYGQASCTACDATCTRVLILQGEVPDDCPSTTLIWSQQQRKWENDYDTYYCSGTVPTTSHGQEAMPSYDSPFRTGLARYTCNNGVWELKGAACDGKIIRTRDVTGIETTCSDSDSVRSMWISWFLADLKRCPAVSGLTWWVTEYNNNTSCKEEPAGTFKHTAHDGRTYSLTSKEACWRDALQKAAEPNGDSYREAQRLGHISAWDEDRLCGSLTYPWTSANAENEGILSEPNGTPVRNGATCKYGP
ncbi:kelch repeat-containing protein [Archangium sp.]|uniref:Kelch repeat-containing protein n=1 Tax=Archangium sp. TaxID=1872627 RepID=UPI00286AE538|nr:kelch repeat-containing protein [Archangium sp.]